MKLRKALGLALAAALLLYAGYLCLLYFAQSSMLYPGAANRVDPRPPDSQGVEVLRISSAAGHTEALFLPATTDSPGTKQPVVVFGHGNGELTDYWLTALSGFRERGIGVLLVEYPGYGRSAGSPSEASIRSHRLGCACRSNSHFWFRPIPRWWRNLLARERPLPARPDPSIHFSYSGHLCVTLLGSLLCAARPLQ
jgi:hypothetical protein